MREIALDTETTGLDPAAGHRVVEIACIELISHLPSGREYHQYLDPERDMPQEAFQIHGLSTEFLAKYPTFAEVGGDFLEFIGDAPLVIHNADFDIGFLNAELKRAQMSMIDPSRAVDTLRIARRKFPGGQHSLDALCRRFEIDLSVREKHGALIDTRLLAAVYLELIGGRQPGLELVSDRSTAAREGTVVERQARPPRPHAPTEAESAAHETFLDKIENPIWRS